MIRCIAVDDEPLALEIIENYLSQIKGIDIVARFTDSVEAFTYLERNPADLLFLDLNMPVLNGMDLLRNLTQKPSIIVTTAYRDFAVESFELDVVDYLVKPISFPRFLKAVNKVISLHMKAGETADNMETKVASENLWLKVDKKMISISAREILYLQSLKDYVRVVTGEQKLVIYHTLQALLEKLSDREFIRIHRSYVVQISKIQSVNGNTVRIRNEVLPIGRIYRKALQDVLRCK